MLLNFYEGTLTLYNNSYRDRRLGVMKVDFLGCTAGASGFGAAMMQLQSQSKRTNLPECKVLFS